MRARHSEGYRSLGELAQARAEGLEPERLDATDSEVLVASLRDAPETDGATAIVFALRDRWEPEVVPALAVALRARSSDVRSAVADVLGRMADMRAAAAVVEQLHDETDVATLEMLCYAAGAMPIPPAIDALRSVLGVYDRRVDVAVRHALERLSYVYPDRAEQIRPEG